MNKKDKSGPQVMSLNSDAGAAMADLDHYSKLVEENEKFSDNLSTALTHLIHNISDVRSMAINVKSLFPEDSSDIILENISELHEKYDNSAS